jgi:hypothetical protein
MGANLYVVSGYLKRSFEMMVLLKNTKLGLWPRAMPKRTVNISLILTQLCKFDHNLCTTVICCLTLSSRLSNGR